MAGETAEQVGGKLVPSSLLFNNWRCLHADGGDKGIEVEATGTGGRGGLQRRGNREERRPLLCQKGNWSTGLKANAEGFSEKQETRPYGTDGRMDVHGFPGQ